MSNDKGKQLVFTIDKDGSTTVEAVGFEGGSCKDATKAFEKALGTTENVKKKPEYFLTSTNKDLNEIKK